MLLIKDGIKLSGVNIANEQNFKKTITGKNTNNGQKSGQMRKTYHLLIGECKGYNFVFAPKRLQEEFANDIKSANKYKNDLKDYKQKKIKYETNLKNKPNKPQKPMFDRGKNEKGEKSLQDELYKLGFTSLIKYDGGKAFFYKTKNYYHNGGLCDNHTGWAIKARK